MARGEARPFADFPVNVYFLSMYMHKFVVSFFIALLPAFASVAGAAPSSEPSVLTASPAKFVVGIYVGTFNSEGEAIAGWRELPAGSKPEGPPVLLDKSAKLVGLRPPPNTTDLDGLIYMILLTLPDGQVQSFFTVPESPWIESRAKADLFVQKLQTVGSSQSKVFERP